MTELPQSSQRLDKWLWCARIFKTRALACRVISGKGARITRSGSTQRTDKPSFAIRPGDRVSLAKERQILILEIVSLAERRGPAPEARTLYIDHTESLTPPTEDTPPA